MKQGRVRKVFPGGNTAYGFYSFYDQVIDPEARRIFILKGGPGVGKSTFLRILGEDLLARGYDVEFLCCSSDNGSLDGVLIPALGVALMDGTAPHVIDPRWPGAVDEIIYLGDYWDEAGLRSHREAIVKLGRTIAQFFASAYRYLAQAKLLQEESESYYTASGALPPSALHRAERELTEGVFQGRNHHGSASSRHLFASAITPDGCVHHFATVFGASTQRFIIRGGSKAARSRLVERVYHEALNRGYAVEAFHCGLIPDYLEHLFLPDLGAAVITTHEYHRIPPQPADSSPISTA
ncbi:MAG: hypothetical protein H5U01_04085 [Clostridia bacterium]|nr:hypothetical protein [Clostridia bacterium]